MDKQDLIIEMLSLNDIQLEKAWIERNDLWRTFLIMNDDWSCWTSSQTYKDIYNKVIKLLDSM